MDPEPAPNPEPLPPESPGWFAPLLLTALIFFVYFFISTCSTIWDRDEARFARATSEMVNSKPSNYLYPTFNGKLRADKPILIYWLMSVPVNMFGHKEWAYRFCSVIGTACACFFTYLIGRWLFTHRAGLWAMVLVALTPMLAATGAVATSDAVLLAFITGAFAVFAYSLKYGHCIRLPIVLILLFAGGLLVKGPVALMPVLPFILTLIFLRKETRRPVARGLFILAAVIAAAGIFMAWYIPANKATNDGFRASFDHHVMKRAAQPLEGHGGHSIFDLFGFYPLVILAGFFPWTLYLPGALVQMYRNDSGGRRGKVFLLTWMLSFLVVMVAVSTKLPHYILPIWPALALCVGAFLDAAGKEDAPSYGGFWTFLGGLLFLLTLAAIVGGLGYGPEYKAQLEATKHPQFSGFWTSFAGESRTPRMVMAALLAMVSLTLIFRHQVAHFARNARTLVIAGFLFLICAAWLLVPAFEDIKISAKLANLIRDKSNENAPVTLCGYNEASLLYYLDKRPVYNIIPDATDPKQFPAPANGGPKPAAKSDYEIRAQAVVDWANVRGRSAVLVIPRAAYEQIRTDKGLPADLYHMDDITGYNYSKDTWVEIMVIRRNE